MKKRVLSILLAILLVLSLAACGNGEEPEKESSTNGEIDASLEGQEGEDGEETRIVKDGAGREVELPIEVNRVICSGVNSLRYTSYLKATDRVVGVEDYETKKSFSRPYNLVNFDKFKDLPIIGGNADPDPEAIIKLEPDAVITYLNEGMDPDELSERVNCPVFVVPSSDSPMDENCYETIRLLGELYGLNEEADALLAYLDEIREDLDRRTKDIKDEDKPSTYVGAVAFRGAHGFEGTEGAYPPFTLVHAKNVVDELETYRPFEVDREKILEWDPDVIFLDNVQFVAQEYKTNPEIFQTLKAFQEGRAYSQLPYRDYAANLDLALINSYYVGKILYPDRFEDIDLESKFREIFEALLGEDPTNQMKAEGYSLRPIDIEEEAKKLGD